MLPELATAPRVIDLSLGRAEIWTPHPWLVLMRAEGVLTMDHVLPVTQMVAAATREAPNRVVLAFDWTEVASFDSPVQMYVPVWLGAQVPVIERAVVGVRSPLVALALRTIRLSVGKRLEVYDEREPVEDIVRNLLPTRAA